MLYCYFENLINTTTYTLTLSTPLSCSIRFRPRNYLAGNLLVVNSVSSSTQSVSSVSLNYSIAEDHSTGEAESQKAGVKDD